MTSPVPPQPRQRAFPTPTVVAAAARIIGLMRLSHRSAEATAVSVFTATNSAMINDLADRLEAVTPEDPTVAEGWTAAVETLRALTPPPPPGYDRR